jgi:hypothetical protein
MRVTSALLGLLLSTTACYRAVPVTRVSGLGTQGDPPPLEQLTVELPLGNDAATQLVRRALFESGLMVSQHDRRGHWMLAEAGAIDDPVLRAMREVYLVASYQPSSAVTTRVSIGALERTLQAMGASRGTGTPQVLTNVRRLSEASGRESGVWARVRAIADYLVDHGGQPLDGPMGAPRIP